MKNILIFSIFTIYINCQNYICRSNDSNDLEIGKAAYLCIHVVEANKRIAIPITIDEYSVATIKGIYNQKSSNSTIQLLAQVGTITSVFPAVRFYIIYIMHNINYSIIFIMIIFIICLIW